MYSIWLKFEDEAQGQLRKMIHRFSIKYGSTSFEPHITLVGEIDLPIKEIYSVCKKLMQNMVDQVIEIKAIGGNESYFMALFFELELPDRLNFLRNDLARALLTNPDDVDPAHLSLVYADANYVEQLDEEDKKLLSFIDNRLTANAIEIVESSRSTPIDQWRAVATLTLNQPN